MLKLEFGHWDLEFKYQDKIIFNQFWFLFLANFVKNTSR